MNNSVKTAAERGEIDVLVVDDDADAVTELMDYLARARLQCRSAPDGGAALQLLAGGVRPQVVVSDLQMPKLNGMEFVDRLGRLPGVERPEVIFVSGHAGFDDAVAALRLGARDMLTKPVDGPKLVQAIRSAQLTRQLRNAPTTDSSGDTAKTAAPFQATDPSKRRRDALKDLKSMRRLRSQYFPSDLFSDPCWEMLLDLYDAHLSRAEVTVTSLGAASGVPQTTALRRMDTLQSHGLISRSDDKDDQRRTIIRLTTAGLAAVERFFETYLGRRTTG